MLMEMIRIGLFWAVVGALCWRCEAQVLSGQWVDQTQQRITKVRQTEVRVIVQGHDGHNAAGVTVTIQQQRHAFCLGFTVGEQGLDTFDPTRRVHRCFNGLALDRLSAWNRLQPQAAQRDLETLRSTVIAAQDLQMTIRWGGVISADLGRLPNWVSELRGQALSSVLGAHAHSVLKAYGHSVQQFDLYTHSLDHDLVERYLGEPMLRRLFEQAHADVPDAAICVRFEDCLTGRRLHQMIGRVTEMRQAFIPVDMVAVEHRTSNMQLHSPLSRALEWMGKLPGKMGVVIVGLDVGGASAMAAATNLETLLRTLFANPNVRSIWLAGLHEGELVEPNAALIDARGEPTATGRTLDGLFHSVWWTDFSGPTDELGNVVTPVFFGAHRVEATLKNGTSIHTTVWVEPSSEQRVILLEPPPGGVTGGD